MRVLTKVFGGGRDEGPFMSQSNFEKLLEKFQMHNIFALMPLPDSSGCRTRAAFMQHSGPTPSLLAPRAKKLTTPQIYRQKL